MAEGFKDNQILELKDTVIQLNQTIAALNTLIVSLQKTITDQEQELRLLREEKETLIKKIFGTSSERMKDTPGQISLFDEAEQEYDPDATSSDDAIPVKEHTRKAKATNKEKFSGLSVHEVVLTLPEGAMNCPVCGTELEVIGKEHIRDEIEFIPAEVRVISYYRNTYGCPNCKKNSDEVYITKPELPEALIPHSFASPSSVAWTMYQKYANAVPLYRQEKDWAQAGIKLSRSTLANWIIHCAMNYFKPVYDYLHRELLKRKFLMADETRVQVLHEPGRNPETDSFMWLFRTGEDGLPVIILYGYTETRAKYNAVEFLKGFSGYLETDGYQGYNDLPGIRRCCCWAHVRRYFFEAISKGKKDDLSEPAVQAVHYCDKLFAFEQKANDTCKTHEARKQYRLQKEQPVLEAFFSWLEKQQAGKGSFGKAVAYAMNRREFLMTYLEDGRCSFSNNLSENAIRPFTLGRKNWLFSDTPKGAEASAVVYSMVEMARNHGLNIFKYLNYLLVNRPSEKMTDEELAAFVPWDERIRQICKN